MSTENDYLIKQLERRYNSLTNLDIRGFFIGLADYVKFVIEKPKLISIVDTYILEEKRKDTKKFEDLKNKAREDLIRFGKELLKEIERAKLVLSTDKETSQLKELILEFRQLENFKSEIDVDVFEKMLVDIIKLLRKNKIKNIPQLARKIPDVNLIKKEEEIYFFPDSYFEYSLERSYYEDLQSKTSWGAWAELYPIYIAMHKRKEWEQGIFPSEPIKKYTEVLKVVDTLELLDKIFQPELAEIIDERELEMLEMINRSLGVKLDLGKNDKKEKNHSLKNRYLSYLMLVHNYLIQHLETSGVEKGKTLQSIHLIVNTIVLDRCETIFLVLDEHFETPIRFVVKNKNTGELTAIAKLFRLVSPGNTPMNYEKRLADNINNGLFRRKRIMEYLEKNKLRKPTLVKKKKSKEGEYLVLADEVPIYTGTISNIVPPQYRQFYIDKTV
jgi:hypothetical protein